LAKVLVLLVAMALRARLRRRRRDPHRLDESRADQALDHATPDPSLETYKAEFIEFRGTGPMVQAMIAGALDCSTLAPLPLAKGVIEADAKAIIIAHVGERSGNLLLGLLGANAGCAHPLDCRHEGRERCTNTFASGVLGPMFPLRHGLDLRRDITAAVGANLTCCAPG
jgi:hypothetical protein